MKSLWDDKEAARYRGDLAKRVYTSRLLGRDESLVLHGGGNTSVKIREKDIFGNMQDLLYIKGSGWDLATIEAPGFAPVLLDHMVKLADLDELSDLQMVNELRTHMTNAGAPTPSVETILHAILPYKYVDHTHADSLITVTNTPGGLERVQDIYGDSVIIVPYIMPGFDLARLCAKKIQQEMNERTKGIVLMNHGIISFADTARESYENMIALVDKAERYIKKHKAWKIERNKIKTKHKDPLALELAQFRHQLCSQSKRPMILKCFQDNNSMDFVHRKDIRKISQQGPATPDHVIRTKRVPLVGRDLDKYINQYRQYFDKHAGKHPDNLTMLDPTPRIVLDKQFGVCTVGKTSKEAQIHADIYQHTIDIILRATQLGGYKALAAKHIFDVEYWSLEQAKLKKGGSAPEFEGEVCLVTGAASGIGKACIDSFLQRGAAVIGLDIDASITELNDSPNFLGLQCDVTQTQQVAKAIQQGVLAFGGIDMLVVNAGVFPKSASIAEIDLEQWQRVMQINLDASVALMQACHPFLQQAPAGGRVAIIGSKNVPAPGPGAAAYSASKAALNQVARIAAMEWGQDNIRINSLHPDAIFDTKIWTPEVLKQRAKHYGMTVEQYKRKNILKTELCSADVAELAAALCSRLFAKTTGAQIPVDGGNDRVI